MRPRSTRAAGALLALALALAGCGGDDDDDGGGGGGGGPATTVAIADPSELAGLQTGPAPWTPELDTLADRLDAIGLPALKQEGQALDLHVQLTVEVDGEEVEVPNGIGLNGQEVAGGRMITGFVSAIHTHDASGLVHVHSPDERPYTLGQVFDVWGVRLTERCVGGYCAGGGKVLTLLDDGEEVDGDPRQLPLGNGQRITVRYGEP